MKPIVLVGHTHSCPMRGQGEVISGTLVDGRSVACVGDTISCGAVIQTGSSPQHRWATGGSAGRYHQSRRNADRRAQLLAAGLNPITKPATDASRSASNGDK